MALPFGGGEGSTSPCENDVWVLANANGVGGSAAWTQDSPSGSAPAPRMQHAAVYDPSTNTMIVYGGQDCFHTVFSDVWVLSNANGLGGTPTWTQLTPQGTGPGQRESSGGVVYDSANNKLIVTGGIQSMSGTGVVTNDVWVLTNANGHGGVPSWTQLSISGPLPPARTVHSTVYAPTNNSLIIFGGQDSLGTLLGGTWALSNANGTGGTPVWTQLGPFTTFPESRANHIAVYHQATNEMTIFGGITTTSGGASTSDAWVLSNSSGAVLQSIAVTPVSPSIAKGQTQQFTATGQFSDGTTQDLTMSATWSSSSTSVATIGASTGSATAVGTGSANITATQNGVTSNTAVLTVTAPDFSLSVANGGSASVTVTAGQVATFNLQVNPLNGFSGSVSLACTEAPTQDLVSMRHANPI